MHSKILKKLKANGYEHLVSFLCDELTESELNSLLLEVFSNRTSLKEPSQVLKDYIRSRFVKPCVIDPIRSTAAELDIFKIVRSADFEVIEFSPLTPLGTCSIDKTVHQNNIVSSLRRTEVVSDVTNVMALEIAKRAKENPQMNMINLATSHRLVRAQGFDHPDYTAHFKVLAMNSSWLDRGKFLLEEEHLIKHIITYQKIFKEVYKIDADRIELQLKFDPSQQDEDFVKMTDRLCEKVNLKSIVDEWDGNNNYYTLLRFGLRLDSLPMPIVDGGLVNWGRILTQNKKRRMLISGFGTELLYKILDKDE